MIFKSKVDAWLIIFILAAFSASFIFPLFDSPDFKLICAMLAIMLPSLLACLYCLFGIKYIVEDSKLTIKVGILHIAEIDIMKITRIEKSRSLLSAPAASIYRIRIYYNNSDEVIISPKNKELFLETVKGINPGIDLSF